MLLHVRVCTNQFIVAGKSTKHPTNCAEVKKAAQVIMEQEDAVPPLYPLDWTDLGVPAAHIVLAADEEVTDVSKPILFKTASSVAAFKDSAKAQMLVAGFGATYKKTDSFKTASWY